MNRGIFVIFISFLPQQKNISFRHLLPFLIRWYFIARIIPLCLCQEALDDFHYNPHYTIITPNVIHPDVKQSLVVKLHNTYESLPINLRILSNTQEFRLLLDQTYLVEPNYLTQINFTLDSSNFSNNPMFNKEHLLSDDQKLHQMATNEIHKGNNHRKYHIPEPSFHEVRILISCDNVIFKFKDSSIARINFTQVVGRIVAYTDKKVYMPGEQVLLNVLQLDENLEPQQTNNRLVILLKDPNQKVMSQIEAKPSHELWSYQFAIGSQGVLGAWTFTIHAGKNLLITHEIQFIVDYYRLPLYMIDLKTDLTHESYMSTVTATFPYGLMVKGKLRLEISQKKLGDTNPTLIKVIENSKFNGTYDLNIPTPKLLPNLERGLQLYSRAIITETLSGVREFKEDVTTLVGAPKSAVYVDFSENSKFYNPGQSYTVQGIVKWLSFSSKSKEPLAHHVSVKVRALYTTPGFGQYKSSRDLITDAGGRFQYTFQPKENGNISIITEVMDTYFATYTIWPRDKNTASLTISLNKKTYVMGEPITPIIRSTALKKPYDLNYLVLCKGQICQSRRLKVINEPPEIYIETTPQMFPVAQLLVFTYADPSNCLVSDWIEFTVSLGPCELEMSIFGHEYHPGSKLEYALKGPPFSHAHILTTDRMLEFYGLGSIPFNQETLTSTLFSAYHRSQDYQETDTVKQFSSLGLTILTDWGKSQDFQKVRIKTSRSLSDNVIRESSRETNNVNNEPRKILQSDNQERNHRIVTAFNTLEIDENGKGMGSIELPPTTISEWRITAYSLQKGRPICFAQPERTFRTFKPVFLVFDLPSTLRLGDQVLLQVIAYNYGDKMIKVNISLRGMYGLCSEALPGETYSKPGHWISAKGSVTVAFPVRPYVLGSHSISVEMSAHGGTILDALTKTLNTVTPPTFAYIPKRDGREHLMTNRMPKHDDKVSSERGNRYNCLLNEKTLLERLETDYNDHNASGSKKIYRLGILASLLTYLKVINKFDSRLQEANYIQQISNLTVESYNSIKTFRKSDGSYSALVTAPENFNLTLWAAKALCLAFPHLVVDVNDFCQTLNWIRHQSVNGSLQDIWSSMFILTLARDCNYCKHIKVLRWIEKLMVTEFVRVPTSDANLAIWNYATNKSPQIEKPPDLEGDTEAMSYTLLSAVRHKNSFAETLYPLLIHRLNYMTTTIYTRKNIIALNALESYLKVKRNSLYKFANTGLCTNVFVGTSNTKLKTHVEIKKCPFNVKTKITDASINDILDSNGDNIDLDSDIPHISKLVFKVNILINYMWQVLGSGPVTITVKQLPGMSVIQNSIRTNLNVTFEIADDGGLTMYLTEMIFETPLNLTYLLQRNFIVATTFPESPIFIHHSRAGLAPCEYLFKIRSTDITLSTYCQHDPIGTGQSCFCFETKCPKCDISYKMFDRTEICASYFVWNVTVIGQHPLGAYKETQVAIGEEFKKKNEKFSRYTPWSSKKPSILSLLTKLDCNCLQPNQTYIIAGPKPTLFGTKVRYVMNEKYHIIPIPNESSMSRREVKQMESLRNKLKSLHQICGSLGAA